jgi:uncharacterized protein with HEPN domain
VKDDLIPLRDILKEIQFLHTVRDRSNFDSFKTNSTDVRACSYSIMVISEAVRRIPLPWLSDDRDTPWHAIRSIGNKLRHEYQGLSSTILWGIIDIHAEELKAAVEAILAKHETE